DAAVARELVGHRAAAVGDDDLQRREVVEYARLEELEYGSRVGVDVVGRGGVQRGVDRGADVDHGDRVEGGDRLPERVPPLVAQPGGHADASAGVRIHVAADEAELFDAAAQLLDAVLGAHPGRLRKLADADKGLGEELADAVDQLVVHLGPVAADQLAPEVVSHSGGLGREDRQIGAALALLLDLAVLQAGLDLLIADVQLALSRPAEIGDLVGAIGAQGKRGGRVVAVDVDDHAPYLLPQ